MARDVWYYLRRGDYRTARRLIRKKLLKKADSHWLLARLAETYDGESRLRRALHYIQKARSLAPMCPLVLWDYASILEAIGKKREALNIFDRLAARGVRAVAYGKCGEGLARARRLIVDCHYRSALCHLGIGRKKEAIRLFRSYFRLRQKGYRSFYTLDEVRKDLRTLKRQGKLCALDLHKLLPDKPVPITRGKREAAAPSGQRRSILS